MRAKVSVTGVQPMFADEAKTNKLGEYLGFSAVCKDGLYPEDGSDEDNSYARWSPSATFKIYVANPNLWGKFEIGKKYYVDFTPAPEPTPEA